MKIPSSVRTLYDNQVGIASRLAERVQVLFEGGKRPDWFYKGRVKSLEGFAQKLETGRVAVPDEMEDLFACTLVVENRASIVDAVTLVKRFCVIRDMRPPVQTETHKRPDAFPFDDLRLYVRLSADESTPPSPLENRTFEVQVKTFLQHAWSIATHDLIYKGGRVEWSRARVAYQVKAMLENAEVSIEMVNEIAASSALAVSDSATRQLREVLTWVEQTWDPSLLPTDRVRLAQTLFDLTRALDLSVGEIIEAVRLDTDAGFGASSVNLSPYGAALQALFRHQTTKVTRFLGSASSRLRDRRVFIVPEMDIAQDLVTGARRERYVLASAIPAEAPVDELADPAASDAPGDSSPGQQ